MAVCCLIPPNGHQKVLEAITDACENSGLGKINNGFENRFYPIINGFLLDGDKNYKLKTSCLTLTNAIISSPPSLDLRMHLRNEFIRQGLNVAIGVRMAQCDFMNILGKGMKCEKQCYYSHPQNKRFSLIENSE